MARRASPTAKLRHFRVLSRARLGYPGLRVMIALISRAGRDGVVQVSQRELALDLMLDPAQVTRALKRCMEAGWVQKLDTRVFQISRGLVIGDEPDPDQPDADDPEDDGPFVGGGSADEDGMDGPDGASG